MEIELSKGGRFNLSQEAPQLKKVSIGLGWQVSQHGQSYDVDASVFMLGADSKVPDERYFVFYNNLQSLDGSLKHSGDNRTGEGNGDDETIFVDLKKINPIIQEIVFVVTIHEAHEKNQNFSQIKNAFIKIYNPETKRSLARYNLREAFSQETALEFGRLYKKDGEWRFQAVGEGYNAGLQSFVDKYIVETNPEEKKVEPKVEIPVIAPTQNAPSLPIDITKKANISLLKTKVDIVLTKKGIANVVARVALVLDISGSMLQQYTSGAVQAFLERIVPVASKLDDDGKLDVWFFGSTFKRTKSVDETNVDGYVQEECGEKKRTFLILKTSSLMKELGFGNNEACVIQDVIKKYTQEMPSKLPTFIVFISDGGVTDEQGITKAVVDAAKYPIFWQFVGLAGSNYGILEKLDTMGGRIVDNADFFHVDDLGKITDEQLYERLLNEFPSWIKKARAKGILN
ncbi:VWA domain-containing protein [Coleofasciculus sp. FACHB-64]|uniref:VWA domain-containing protein n=1 Tax=Cyanophyceae TaxID=3028117 RepID=UPI0016860556|nr:MULTISPECIES: VWA domain-containing protein [unclassified Coleofasciculus]MBD1840671.1 VWA domain-containing protein [Coleofasciculus sp. FACHB-501]MBD2047744.1 VWA domain-containing protein [Coleofasciculus sp. FACHB-64]